MALRCKITNRLNLYLLLSAATTSFVFLPECHAALAPVTLDADERSVAEARAQANAAEPATTNKIINFRMQPFRLGGTLSYSLGYDSADGISSKQRGISASLNAGTGIKGYVWHPALSNFDGDVSLNTQSANSGSYITSSGGSKNNANNVTVTGRGKLSILQFSRFPFEIHVDKTDTRSNNYGNYLSTEDSYSNLNYGFIQRYTDPKLSGTLQWDRYTQFNGNYGGSRQENLQLAITPILGSNQNLQLSGSSIHNLRERTGENSSQDSAGAQHSFSPSADISVSSSVDVGRSGYRLAQGESSVHTAQLSSVAFWHPKATSLGITGGVRLFGLTNDGNDHSTANAFTSRSRTVNYNVGANYDFSSFTRLTASGNLNLSDVNGNKSTSNSESLGIGYNPSSIVIGNYNYTWSTSGNVNRTADESNPPSRQLSLQLSHGLSRNINFNGGTLGMSASESISSIYSTTRESAKQLGHSGSLMLSLAQSTSLSLTASDSRTLGTGDYIQMINFQASSNFAAGRYSSWNGNLTIQAVRQKDGANSNASQNFVTTSSGSINYQNQRAFGVPRLQFTSDLRLNSQAILPVLSGPDENVTSSWTNSLAYSIGLTQLNLYSRLSKSAGKTNKSVMFTATRRFGNS